MNRIQSVLCRHLPKLKNSQKAFTLIEIAIVIAIITLLALGIAESATYFRNQANRSLCIVVQKQVQDGMRSIQNLQNLDYGSTFVASALYGTSSSYFPVEPVCPATGTSSVYGITATYFGTTSTANCTIPGISVEFMQCGYTNSSSALNHNPSTTQIQGW